MVVKCFVFETRGGDLLEEVEPASATWSVRANEAEDITLTLDLNSVEGSRDWPNLGTAWKHSIAVDVYGRLFGGPIMPHDLDDDKAELTVKARGFRVATARMSVLPVAALTQSLTLPNGEPDTSLDTTISGYDLGTIGKKATQLALGWPGRTDIPVLWPDDRPGTQTVTYPAIERIKVDRALSDLSGMENGPDIRFQLLRDGPDRFQWRYEAGTEAQPRLQGQDVFAWEIGQGSGLRVLTNPTQMGSVAWSQGGRADDTSLVRMQYDPTLVDAGFPLLELESGASLNTVEAAVLDGWNVEKLRTAKKPWQFWSFNVRADQQPFPYEFNVGDLIDVIVTEDTPVSGGYVPQGTYRRRIAGMSGAMSEWITITCGEVYDE